MAVDLFVPRSGHDAAHPFLPLPSAEPGSIVPEDEDGEVRSLLVNEFEVQVVDGGRKPRQIIWGQDLKATLVVTDTRMAFASTRMLRSFRARGLTLVGHLRYEWLGGVAGGLKPQSYLRVVFPSPDDLSASDLLYIVTFRPNAPIQGRRWNTQEVAGDVARRANLRRAAARDPLPPLGETPLAKGGSAWVARDEGAPWHAAVAEYSTKRLGLYG